MGKKYLDTKQNTLEAAVMKVWQVAAEELDKVDKKALKKDFDDRAKEGDGDLDNDGDEDESDEYLHKKRQAIGKAMAQDNKKKNDKKKNDKKNEGLEDSPNAANSQHLCA